MLRGRLQEVEDTDMTTALWVSRDGCRASYGELKVEEFGDGESDFYCPNGRDVFRFRPKVADDESGTDDYRRHCERL
jgi:hypothetical protein